jgi:hypothetical protein
MPKFDWLQGKAIRNTVKGRISRTWQLIRYRARGNNEYEVKNNTEICLRSNQWSLRLRSASMYSSCSFLPTPKDSDTIYVLLTLKLCPRFTSLQLGIEFFSLILFLSRKYKAGTSSYPDFCLPNSPLQRQLISFLQMSSRHLYSKYDINEAISPP